MVEVFKVSNSLEAPNARVPSLFTDENIDDICLFHLRTQPGRGASKLLDLFMMTCTFLKFFYLFSLFNHCMHIFMNGVIKPTLEGIT